MAVTYKFKTKPAPYQREAVVKTLQMKRFGVFFEQRVGKTKVGADVIGALHVGRGVTRVLVLGTVSSESTWKTQLEEHLGYPYEYKVLPKNKDSRSKFVKAAVKGLTILHVTYDTMSSAWAHMQVWKPELVIMDEVHCVKNPNSKRSRAVYKVVKDIEYRLGLTGTPIAHKPLDVFGVFKVIDETVFGTSLPKFKQRYCVMGGYMGYEVVGYVNTEELSRKMADHSIRVLRKDVLEEPHVEYLEVPVKLEPSAYKLYNELRKNWVAELKSGGKITADLAGVRATRLQQICGGFMTLDNDDPDKKEVVQVSSAKLNSAVALIKDKIENDEKVVVFVNFLREISALENMLKTDLGIQPLVITGAVSSTVREKLRIKFQTDPNEKIIILQEKAGSMSICLDAAHINVYYSLNRRLLDFQQSRDRVMGRGQKSDVTNYMMVVEKTIDEKIVKALKNNEDLASSIADKWRWLLEEQEESK